MSDEEGKRELYRALAQSWADYQQALREAKNVYQDALREAWRTRVRATVAAWKQYDKSRSASVGE